MSKTVLLPCNGLSARGRLAADIANGIRDQIEDVEVVDLVPLLAQLPDAVSIVKSANRVIALSGCINQCESKACHITTQREPDLVFQLEHELPVGVTGPESCPPGLYKQLLRTITSQLLGELD